MHVDFSVELGRDDPALELPWRSHDSSLRYYDLKAHPELLPQIPEASAYPELGAFLARVNTREFPLHTAKCDAWLSREILPEEEIFAAECKFVSYIDLVFAEKQARLSFEKHEELAQSLCRLLKRAPDIAATVEFAIRRCYYHDDRDSLQPQSNGEPGEGTSQNSNCELSNCEHRATDSSSATNVTAQSGFVPSGSAHRSDIFDSQSGFYLTVYVTGFGNGIHEASKQWAIALTLLQNALVQAAHTNPAS